MTLRAIIAAVAMFGEEGLILAGECGLQAPQESRAPAPARTARLDVTFLVNGSPSGEVGVETTTAGDASIDVQQLLARLSSRVSRSVIDELVVRAGGRAFAPVADLRSETFPLLFDLASLQLRVDVPLEARALNQISVAGGRGRRLEGEATPPSNLAFGVSLTFADRLRALNDFRDFEREPFNLGAQGFVNVGGKDGVYLTFLAGLREQGNPFRRRTTLFHDDERRAIRYSAGDIDPLISGSFSNPISLVGVGVERLYQTIQPYRNLRPAGRGGLVLERPSRVEVLVNGQAFRTLSLGAGRYDLRDFPFLDGLNDVRLVVRDDAGRDESINLSFFSDTELLEEGLSIFSAVLGFRQAGFGEFSETRYTDSPAFSGLYQYGVSDRLTLGGSLQVDRENAFLTGLSVVGTPLGLFAVEGALDSGVDDDLQGAVLLSFRSIQSRRDGRQDRLEIDLQAQSERFSPLEAAAFTRNRYRYDVTGRYQTSLAYDVFATVGAGFSKGRGAQRDLTTVNAGLSRSFNRVNVGINYSYRSDSALAEHRATVSISVPLSRRQFARASFDTAGDRVSLDYTYQGFEGLDQTTSQVSFSHDDAGQAANIEVDHFSNRFRASARHDYVSVNGSEQQNTDIAFTTGVGYADGQWAVGRDPGRGFVIVRPHASLQSTGIVVSNQYTLGPSARSGALGPALAPIQRGYQPDTLEVAVPKLPLGYDIGPGRLDILPGAASGYLWTIGSAASNTVVGRIVDEAGQPVPFLAGMLNPISGKEAKAVPFFTNRTGRMVAQQLAPGRYGLVPAGAQAAVAEIVVPERSDGPVDVGVLTIRKQP